MGGSSVEGNLICASLTARASEHIWRTVDTMVLWTCHDMLCFMLRSRSECFTEGRSPSIVCSWCVVGQVLLPTRTARYAGLWAVPSPMSGHSRSRSQRVLAAVLKMASALRPPSPDTKKAFHIRDNPLAVGAQGRFFPVCGADLRCVNACSSIGRWLKDFELRYGTRHKWTCWLWVSHKAALRLAGGEVGQCSRC